jgi:hypothetical protein
VIAAILVAQLVAALPPPAPPPADDPAWRVLKVIDGVTLKRAEPSGGARAPWGMGEGEIAARLDAVVAHLTDFEGLVRFVPRLQTVRVLARGDGEALVYFRFDLPWPISDRDWTVRYRYGRDAAGSFHMRWWDENQHSPPARWTVRVGPVRGAWLLTPTGRGTTRARYTFLAELGGRMPRGVVDDTVWKQPLQTLQGVRRAVVR